MPPARLLACWYVGLQACLKACWQACWLAGWLAGRLDSRFACRLACTLAGSLYGCQDGLLVGWLLGWPNIFGGLGAGLSEGHAQAGREGRDEKGFWDGEERSRGGDDRVQGVGPVGGGGSGKAVGRCPEYGQAIQKTGELSGCLCGLSLRLGRTQKSSLFSTMTCHFPRGQTLRRAASHRGSLPEIQPTRRADPSLPEWQPPRGAAYQKGSHTGGQTLRGPASQRGSLPERQPPCRPP